MGTARDLVLLMLRLGVGASSFTRGAKELFGGGEVEETVGTSTAWGSEPGDRSVRLSGVLETGGGALLALGLATGTAGAALTGNMIVASSVQTSNRFLNTSERFELPVTYALVGHPARADRAGAVLGRPRDRWGAEPALDACPDDIED